MKAVLGSFAVDRARERFDDLDAAVESAIRHYQRRLVADPGWLWPPAELAAALDPPLVEIEVDLSPAASGLLAAESLRLGVERQLVLNHVVLLYLADLDRRTRQRRCGGRKRGHSTLGR